LFFRNFAKGWQTAILWQSVWKTNSNHLRD